MPPNSFNTYQMTLGAGGPPAPNRSTYPAEIGPAEFGPDDARPDSNSENQLAQNSTSNPSRQYNDNNRGGNSASRSNSSSNATSGQSYRQSQGVGHSSSSSNRNQNDNRDSRSFTNVQRPLGNTNTGSQSYGGTNSSFNPPSDSNMAGRATQSGIDAPWNPIASVRSDSRGGSGGRGSARGFDQTGGYVRGYGNGDEDGDGDSGSLDVGLGSETSGRSSRGRR